MDRIPTLRRIARWTFWVVLVFAILGTVVWTTSYAIGTSRMNREIRSLREAGFAVSYQDVAPPSVADEDNAASYYVAAFALLVGSESVGSTFSRALEQGARSLSVEEKASLRTWLAKNADAFGLLHRALARSSCRYKRDYRLGWAMELPEIGQTIKAAKYLSIRAQLQAEDGDGQAARESIRDGLALADSLRDEPVLVSQLVLLVDVGVTLEAVSFCITPQTPAPELADWLALLPSVSKFDGMMEPALRGELACTVEMVAQSNDDIVFANNTLNPALSHRLVARLFRPLIRWDLPRYARLLRRILDLSRRPYLETQAGADEIDREVRAAMLKWSQPVVQSLIPAVNRIFRNQAACQAQLAVTRAGLECEIARAAKGEYPEKIQSMDPFTGRPLLLRDGKVASAVPQDTPPIEWKLRRP